MTTVAAGQSVAVTLRFEDGIEKTIAVAPGQFVLDAALEQGVPLVYQCRSGSCSTCVATITRGSIETAPGRAVSLLASEVAEGRRLLCVCYAHAPSAVREHYPSTLIYTAEPRTYAASVVALDWPAARVAQLAVEVDRADGFNFQSGQYVRVQVPGTDEWRSYSMASTPHELPRLEFLVRIIAGGAMSEYLRTRAQPGDTLQIEGPRGAFILRPARASHIFIAGGTGLAPILSLIDALRRRPGARPNILLSFGCSSDADFFYRDEIELRQWWMPTLRVILSAGRIDNSDVGLARGNPVTALAGESIVDATTVAYACGPPGMIEAARVRLIEMGVAPERIYAERFVAS
jgi:ferredoxin-NADP reductase/ferredoxin